MICRTLIRRRLNERHVNTGFVVYVDTLADNDAEFGIIPRPAYPVVLPWVENEFLAGVEGWGSVLPEQRRHDRIIGSSGQFVADSIKSSRVIAEVEYDIYSLASDFSADHASLLVRPSDFLEHGRELSLHFDSRRPEDDSPPI